MGDTFSTDRFERAYLAVGATAGIIFKLMKAILPTRWFKFCANAFFVALITLINYIFWSGIQEALHQILLLDYNIHSLWSYIRTFGEDSESSIWIIWRSYCFLDKLRLSFCFYDTDDTDDKCDVILSHCIWGESKNFYDLLMIEFDENCFFNR